MGVRVPRTPISRSRTHTRQMRGGAHGEPETGKGRRGRRGPSQARGRRRLPCSPSTGGSTCRPLPISVVRCATREASTRSTRTPWCASPPGTWAWSSTTCSPARPPSPSSPATPSASPRRCRTSPRPTRPSWSRAVCSATGPHRGRRQGPGRPRAPRGAPRQVRRLARCPAAAVRRPARGPAAQLRVRPQGPHRPGWRSRRSCRCPGPRRGGGPCGRARSRGCPHRGRG